MQHDKSIRLNFKGLEGIKKKPQLLPETISTHAGDFLAGDSVQV